MAHITEYDYDKVLRAIGEIYISLHLFDLKNGSLKAIKSNQFIDKFANEKEELQAKLNHVMENITEKESIKAIVEFIDFSTIDERMGNENNIATTFKGKINGWCVARFIVLDRAEDGSINHVIFTVENINRKKERENRLLELSRIDQLTGILNRGSGEYSIRKFIDSGENGVFGLFDVDHFKQVNDIYGHNIGDQVLIAIAQAMKSVFRSEDIIMRLGGDEFAFYAVGNFTADTITNITQRLFSRISVIHVDPMVEKITVSLGLALRNSEDTFDTLYKRADHGVYSSKHNKGCSFSIE